LKNDRFLQRTLVWSSQNIAVSLHHQVHLTITISMEIFIIRGFM
jgi:hypothetical protein